MGQSSHLFIFPFQSVFDMFDMFATVGMRGDCRYSINLLDRGRYSNRCVGQHKSEEELFEKATVKLMNH